MKTLSTVLLVANLWGFPGWRVPAEFVGMWEGSGHEIVSWSEEDSIFFSLEIHEDGTVTGHVGDAVLENGVLKTNGWFVQLLGNPKYIIGGDLNGAIVEKEGIFRKKLRWLLLDYINGQFEGGFHTSGTFTHPWAGNNHWKKHMRMTGVDVKLFRKH